MRGSIRILLVGDDGVGKSSLVSSFIKEEFVQVPPRSTHPQVTIPPEVMPDANVTTYIVDSSPRPDDLAQLHLELRKAHVVCIVYAINQPSSFDRIGAYWLPMMRGLGVNVPVILVGNKIDLRGGEVTNEALEEEILPLMSLFKEVETCVECSARIPLNVSEVFYYAQKAVMHPTAPLWDGREQTLKPLLVSALSRIFSLCDVNKDGVLSDAELNEFQRKVFSTPLQTHELEGIKNVLREADPRYVALDWGHPVSTLSSGAASPTMTMSPMLGRNQNVVNGSIHASTSLKTLAADVDHQHGIDSDGLGEAPRIAGITLEGFLYLHMMFIQRGRLETTWTVLRRFGYGEDLELRDDFLRPRFDVPSDHVAELSPKGYQFFTDLFEVFDKDKDGALNQEEIDALFSTSPGNPWINQGFPDTTVTAESGAVTLQGWLAQWSMTTLLDHRVTLAYLAYLGYSDATSVASSSSYSFSSTSSSSATAPTPTTPTALLALPSRRSRRSSKGKSKQPKRNVFLAYILGAAGSGKTGILRTFINKETGGILKGRYEPTRGRGEAVVNSVEVGGSERYLVLQEFGSNYESEVLRNPRKLNLADVIIFVYDSSDTNSFSYISNLRQQYRLDDLPSLFVATKSDLDLAQQRHEVQPDVYCRRLSLQVPVAVSVKTGQMADLYHIIVLVAQNPELHLPGGPDRSTGYGIVFWSAALVGGVSAALIAWRQLGGRPGMLFGGSGNLLTWWYRRDS